MAAVAVGACLVEKHFTLSQALPEGDNDMSLEPAEFKAMVQGIREVEAALGTGVRTLLPEEAPLLSLIRRGVYARNDIRKGDVIDAAMIAVRRPLSSIPADEIDQVIGRRAIADIPANEPVSMEQLGA